MSKGREKGAAYYTTERSSLTSSCMVNGPYQLIVRFAPGGGVNDATFLIGEARLTATLHCAPGNEFTGNVHRQLRFEKSTIPALFPGRSYDVNRSNRISNRCSNSEFIHCTRKMLSTHRV
jgi:hypothetical protein